MHGVVCEAKRRHPRRSLLFPSPSSVCTNLSHPRTHPASTGRPFFFVAQPFAGLQAGIWRGQIGLSDSIGLMIDPIFRGAGGGGEEEEFIRIQWIL